MCLAVPGKIIKIKGDTAIIDYGSEKRSAKIINDASIGEWVIVSGGFVVEKVDGKTAEEFLKKISEM